MSDVRYIKIEPNEEGQRLDNYLIRQLKGVPKTHIYRLIRGGEVRVNKKRAQAATRVCCGDLIRIPPVRVTREKDVQVSVKLNQRLQESIIYEDAYLLVVNKPAGIAVHGGSGMSLGIIEALRKIRTDLPYLELIHRLDKETSGCLLLAKKRSILRLIQALLAKREVRKIYWALLADPWVGKKSITVEASLEKNILKSGERMVMVHHEGKTAQTEFKLLENFCQACWVEVQPKTGRTHQIRVHSAFLGHPIIGDEKYGGRDLVGQQLIKPRLYLHARSIQFNLNGQTYQFQADLDERFSHVLETLRMRSSVGE